MLTASEVRDVYRGVLGREAESENVVEHYISAGYSLDTLISDFLASNEYQLRAGRKRSHFDAMYDGLVDGNVALLERHLTPTTSEEGFVKSFLGVRMRVSHNDSLSHLSGTCYNDIPTRMTDYHAEPIEFVGTLKAVEAGRDRFVAVELGAGWGSWSIIAGHVARKMGRDPIKLYAVEANGGKVANMHIHYTDNGFDPAKHCLVKAIVGAQDGHALFPLGNAAGDWGASAIFTKEDEERAGYEKVRSISLETLLKDEEVVDLIHFDVQGAEAESIAASVDVLTRKVRYMVVGTHGRAIEGRIIGLLLSHGWQLENEQPARIVQALHGRESLYVDGTQVWRNPTVT